MLPLTPILGAADPAVLIGGVLTGLAALIGAYATVVARRTENKSATREETEQALKAQDALLDRYEKRIENLEKKLDEYDTKLQLAVEGKTASEEAHAACVESLAVATRRIGELESEVAQLKKQVNGS